MIKNFFLFAVRNISRYKVLTFINVTGLAIGAIKVAMLTVSFQAYKATGINPSEALKVE